MKKGRYCDASIIGILKQAERGVPVVTASRTGCAQLEPDH